MPSSADVFPEPIQTKHFLLELVAESDFESLYAVASDPLIWGQHPESNRWQRDIFSVFFSNGLANDLGCFVIRERLTQEVVGSTVTTRMINVFALASHFLLGNIGVALQTERSKTRCWSAPLRYVIRYSSI